MKIAVIGHTGVVGNAIYQYYKKDAMGLSLDKQTHSYDEINAKAHYIFVCVPTPYNEKRRESDLTAIYDVLDKIDDGKIVVIKSTIPPGTTKKLQEKYTDLIILFNPEFLSAKHAEKEFRFPDRQLVGYTDKSFRYAMDLLNFLPLAPHEKIMPSTEAEICKYVNNFHGSLMVIFANFIYDVCEEANADFESVKESSIASKYVGSSMGRTYWDVHHGGFRGYGGMCFPKDMNSLLAWAKKHKIRTKSLLEETVKINHKLLKSQGLTEKEVSLP